MKSLLFLLFLGAVYVVATLAEEPFEDEAVAELLDEQDDETIAERADEENDPRRRPKPSGRPPRPSGRRPRPSGRPPKPSRQGKIFVVFTLNPWTLMSKRSFTAKVCSWLTFFLYNLIKYMHPASSLVFFFFSSGSRC